MTVPKSSRANRKCQRCGSGIESLAMSIDWHGVQVADGIVGREGVVGAKGVANPLAGAPCSY